MSGRTLLKASVIALPAVLLVAIGLDGLAQDDVNQAEARRQHAAPVGRV